MDQAAPRSRLCGLPSRTPCPPQPLGAGAGPRADPLPPPPRTPNPRRPEIRRLRAGRRSTDIRTVFTPSPLTHTATNPATEEERRRPAPAGCTPRAGECRRVPGVRPIALARPPAACPIALARPRAWGPGLFWHLSGPPGLMRGSSARAHTPMHACMHACTHARTRACVCRRLAGGRACMHAWACAYAPLHDARRRAARARSRAHC